MVRSVALLAWLANKAIKSDSKRLAFAALKCSQPFVTAYGGVSATCQHATIASKSLLPYNREILVFKESSVAQVPLPTPIYHFTHISNLSSLISSGGIICKNGVDSSSITYQSSAYESVQGHRESFEVPVDPGGVIHDYVPFYFNSLSPMLYAVHRGNIPGVDMR